MSTQHTQGRILIAQRDAPKGTLTIASDQENTGLIATMEHGKTRMPNYQQAEANARRLVACWNYFEKLGWTTEEIESRT